MNIRYNVKFHAVTLHRAYYDPIMHMLEVCRLFGKRKIEILMYMLKTFVLNSFEL